MAPFNRFTLLIVLTLFASVPVLQAQEEKVRPIYHGNRNLRMVSLTIDDGWVNDPELLEVLDRYQIPVTVFIPGRVAEQRPEFVHDLARRGYEICNHTFSHRWLTRLSDEEIREEFRKNQELLFQLTGQTHPYIRPPGGDWNERVLRIATEEGYRLVLWDNDAMGYRDDQTMEDQLTLLRKHKKNGNIILCHFGSRLRTAQVMAILIPEMLSEGYQFVTLTELLSYSGDTVLIADATSGHLKPPGRSQKESRTKVVKRDTSRTETPSKKESVPTRQKAPPPPVKTTPEPQKVVRPVYSRYAAAKAIRSQVRMVHYTSLRPAGKISPKVRRSKLGRELGSIILAESED